MNKRTKIIVADDHRIVSGGIQAILETTNHFDIIGIAENGEEVIHIAANQKPDIVLMDINMPIMNGIECTKRLKEKDESIKVIIITMYNRKQFLRELIEVGADGCILKNDSGKELLNAIDRVLSDKTYFDQLKAFIDAPKAYSDYQLSEREIEIIELVSEGLTSKEIADRLFIAEYTVKTHRKNIFKKTNVKSADQLVEWAINIGLL